MAVKIDVFHQNQHMSKFNVESSSESLLCFYSIEAMGTLCELFFTTNVFLGNRAFCLRRFALHFDLCLTQCKKLDTVSLST